MFIMKEQWKLQEKTVVLEEGRRQEERESTTEIKPKVNRCKGPMQYVKLVLYIELILFFGWGCYMILQIHRSELIEREIADIIHERDLPTFGSQSALNSNAETPVIFAKPEVILEKLNKLMENIKLIQEQNLKQNNAIDVNAQIHTSTQNSIIEITEKSDDIVKEDDLSNLWTFKFPDLIFNEETTINSASQKIDLSDDINTRERDKDSIYNSRIFTKLRDIASLKDIEDFEKITHKLTENTNNSTFNRQENHVSNTTNETEDLNLEDRWKVLNSDDSIASKSDVSFLDSVENLELEYYDDEEQDYYEKRSFYDDALVQDFSQFFHTVSPEKAIAASSSPNLPRNFVSAETEKPNNLGINVVTRSANDNIDYGELISISGDVSATESDQTQSLFDKFRNVRNMNQHSLEVTKNAKSNEKSMENQWLSSSLETQDSEESSILNGDSDLIQWFIPPSRFASDLPAGPSNMQNSKEQLMPDASNKASFDCVECNGDSVGKSEDELLITEKNPDNEWTVPIYNVLGIRINPPNDKTSNVVLSDSPNITETDSSNSTENEQEVINNSNKEGIEREPVVSEHDFKFSSNLDTVTIDNEWHSSSEIFDKQQQEPLGITDKYKNVMSLSDINEEIQKLEELLISSVKGEILTFVRGQNGQNNGINVFLNTWDYYLNGFCSNTFKCSEPKYIWRQRRLDELRKYLQNIRDGNHPDDLRNDSNYRKKRMVKDPTWTREEVSNGFEEDNDSVDVDVIEQKRIQNTESNLKRLFQQMDTFSSSIDELYELYLSLNKLYDDYGTNKIPIEMIRNRRIS